MTLDKNLNRLSTLSPPIVLKVNVNISAHAWFKCTEQNIMYSQVALK